VMLQDCFSCYFPAMHHHFCLVISRVSVGSEVLALKSMTISGSLIRTQWHNYPDGAIKKDFTQMDRN